MVQIKELFSIYRGLKKELYVLAFGRIVTAMGALIWPMMTLILKSKLGFTAGEIGILMMVMSLIMIPMNLLGGKLADHFNKKYIIVFFDLLSVVCYFISGFIPLSFMTLLMFFVGSIFQNMEGPAYDSLVADLSDPSERERAYSLSYLSMNVGMVLSPILGGILFQNHLNLAFIISGCSILTSTCLIFFLVKDIKKDTAVQTQNVYEAHHEGSVLEVLKTMPLLILFFLIASIGSVIYAQFNFLVPLHLEQIYSETGAFYFGILSSTNAFVVILFTPLFTKLFVRWHDIDRLILGAFFQMISLSFYIFITNQLGLSVISVIGFTFGEILTTLSSNPYLTKRIPASHRGRILSISNNIMFVVGSMANLGIGQMADAFKLQTVWIFITLLGCFQCFLFFVYRRKDKKKFALLYASRN